MLSKRPAPVRFIDVIVAVASLASLASLAMAADLPMGQARKSHSAAGADSGQRPASGKPHADARDRQTALVKKNSSRRPEKGIQKKIVTYNLYPDPVFKLKGAETGKRTPPVLAAVPVPPNAALRPAPARSSVPALKLEEPDNSGIAFGCNDRPFRKSASVRELTACYKHNVDKSWKTQTYLSRDVADSQKWGGGLAVRYAY